MAKTYAEQARRFVEMLDEDYWLHQQVHARVARSPAAMEILRRAREGEVPAEQFLKVYRRHAAKVIEVVCEAAKLVLTKA